MTAKLFLLTAALARAVLAVPAATTTAPTSVAATQMAAAAVTASYSGNPFSGVQQWANAYYASEISASAIPSLTGAMATKAAAVAKVPTFQWLCVTLDFPNFALPLHG